MRERSCIQNRILLCGESDGHSFKRTFTVTKKINEGGSVICYEAFYDSSSKGILKEFYPQEAYGLTRNNQNQLIHDELFQDAKVRFNKELKQYLEPYQMLLNIKKNCIEHDLDTFIPFFEIYYGCDENCNHIGSTYIWTPETELETFDKICNDIHKHPTIMPEHKLVTVLSAIESLTKCICTLHKEELVHRDIKPSNFGFKKRGKEVLTQTLSLFDINTICSIYSTSTTVVGTKGYMEPEAFTESYNNLTDIYSIGATLFSAIIVNQETKKDYLYDDNYYERISEFVNTSELITASEANSHPTLRSILTRILKKCLCERESRYENCEELIHDLSQALYYSLPSDLAKQRLSNEKWVLKDVEKSLDQNIEKNSYRAMQYLLYQYPLYKYSKNNHLNVMVIGFGNYGQKFLDVCLQIGQMRDKNLNTVVLTNKISDKDIYLNERKALCDFFEIDHEYKKENYGKIHFHCTEITKEKQNHIDILKKVMKSYYEGKVPHYIFIALGDNELNKKVALSLNKEMNQEYEKCMISYAWEASNHQPAIQENVIPVRVHEKIEEQPLFKEIDRMAVNVHSIWDKSINSSYQSKLKMFKKSYYYDSCVSCVLSIKYKLYSIGIDLDTCSLNDAANQFIQKDVVHENNQSILNDLIYYEHRRWVSEKLCQGWTQLKDLDSCMYGMTKDVKRKQHVCIIKSQPNQKLTLESKKWENISEDEIENYDELDQLSIHLHQKYVQEAKKVKKNNHISSDIIRFINELTKGHRELVIAFQEWQICMKDIWNGNHEKVYLYEGLKEKLLSASQVLPNEKQKVFSRQVKSLETLFYPVLASNEYHDYKQADRVIIDKIPYILTFSNKTCLTIPFSLKDQSSIFSNVAAAKIIKPSTLIYLCSVKDNQELNEVCSSFQTIYQWIKKSQMKSNVTVVVTYPKNKLDENKIKHIFNDSNEWIKNIQCLDVKDEAESTNKIIRYLKRRNHNYDIFAVEKNDTKLSQILENNDFYHTFSSYQFNAYNQTFTSINNCQEFLYLNQKSYITVSDLISSNQPLYEINYQPEFYHEYQYLWIKYNENRILWKKLCQLLSQHSKKQDILTEFNLVSEKSNPEIYRCIIHNECRIAVEKMMKVLIENQILEKESTILSYTTDSCEVIFKGNQRYFKNFDELFNNPYKLTNDLKYLIYENKITILFDSLIVENITIESKEMIEILHDLSKIHLINSFEEINGKIKFNYATKAIKNLCTTPERILEIYLYHITKEMNIFHDVAIGYKVEDQVKKNCCLLTKGYTSLMIECWDSRQITAKVYSNFEKNVKKIGIHSKAILVLDEEVDAVQLEKINEWSKKYGIISIWKSNEIHHIDITLRQLLNENRKGEE